MKKLVFAAAALTVVVWAFGFGKPRPVRFRHRALTGRPLLSLSSVTTLFSDDPLSAEFKSAHTSFANQALIVRDQPLMDSADFAPGNDQAKFGLVALLRALPGSPATTTDTVTDWLRDWVAPSDPNHSHRGLERLKSRWSTKDPERKLATLPLRPLAVVNRMDLAHIDSTGSISGAELRFVYADDGPSNNDHFFTMILEFVLQDMPLNGENGFVAMGKEWYDLAAKPVDQFRTAFPDTLRRMLQRVGSARIRTNTSITGSLWSFGEFAILNQTAMTPPHRIDKINLTQQPTHLKVDLTKCQLAGGDMAVFAKTNTSDILNSTFKLSPALSTTDQPLYPSDRKVLTFEKNALDQRQDEVRFALSINSCVGCHGLETQNATTLAQSESISRGQFDQIHYRQAGAPSTLSYFLSGGTKGDPTTDFAPIDPSPYLVQEGACAGATAEPRKYNDLVRRHLFLDTLVTNPPTSADDWQNRFVVLGLVGSPVH